MVEINEVSCVEMRNTPDLCCASHSPAIRKDAVKNRFSGCNEVSGNKLGLNVLHFAKSGQLGHSIKTNYPTSVPLKTDLWGLS